MNIPRSAKDSKIIKMFLERVIEIGKEIGVSIGHEDGYGAFVVYDYNNQDADWLRDALDETSSIREVKSE